MTPITYSYDSYDDAQRNVDALISAGIARDDISLVSNEHVHDSDAGSPAADGAGVGGFLGGTAGLLAGLGLIAIPGLGPVVAAGWLAATAAGALAGAAIGGAAGGVVGALTDAGLDEKEAQVHAESIRRGGSLVSVRARDGESPKVHDILRRGAIDVGERRTSYESEGWAGFDPNAPAWRSTPPAGDFEPEPAQAARVGSPHQRES